MILLQVKYTVSVLQEKVDGLCVVSVHKSINEIVSARAGYLISTSPWGLASLGSNTSPSGDAPNHLFCKEKTCH